MPAINKVYLMGNLTRTPELRYTPNGTAICEFGMAINRRYISNGIRKDETTFIEVNVWQKQAEVCKNRLQKGALVMVEGRLKTDHWEEKDTGKKRSRIVVVAERVHFLATPPRDENYEEYENDSSAQQNNPQRQPYSNTRQNQYLHRQNPDIKHGGQATQQSRPQSAPQQPSPNEPLPPPEPEYDDVAEDGDEGDVPF